MLRWLMLLLLCFLQYSCWQLSASDRLMCILFSAPTATATEQCSIDSLAIYWLPVPHPHRFCFGMCMTYIVLEKISHAAGARYYARHSIPITYISRYANLHLAMKLFSCHTPYLGVYSLLWLLLFARIEFWEDVGGLILMLPRLRTKTKVESVCQWHATSL